MIDDQATRLECLRLAVQFCGKGYDDPLPMARRMVEFLATGKTTPPQGETAPPVPD